MHQGCPVRAAVADHVSFTIAGTAAAHTPENVRVLRHDARHAAQAEARAQPIDQMVEFFGVIVAASPVCAGSVRSVTSAESRTVS